MMKLLVALCVVGVLSSMVIAKPAIDKEAFVKDFMEKAEVCMGETGATKVDIDDIVKEKASSSDAGKCMRACIMKKYKVLKDDNKLDLSVAMEHAKLLSDGDENKLKLAKEIIDICSVIPVPDNECEMAELYGHCMKEEAAKRGITKADF